MKKNRNPQKRKTKIKPQIEINDDLNAYKTYYSIRLV